MTAGALGPQGTSWGKKISVRGEKISVRGEKISVRGEKSRFVEKKISVRGEKGSVRGGKKIKKFTIVIGSVSVCQPKRNDRVIGRQTEYKLHQTKPRPGLLLYCRFQEF